MSDAGGSQPADLILPAKLVTRVDVSRLVSELEWVDGEMISTEARAKTGIQAGAQPVLSDQLTEFLDKNKLSLEDSKLRNATIKRLRVLKNSVPVVHMTFAQPADRASLQQLAQWLRDSVHPQAVIAVGLQPGIVGGVYIRTPNHILDLSWRAKLQNSRGLLVKELEALRGSK